jgi:hypothetical protein
MIGKAELLRWVNTLDDQSSIGIDEGGLCLREVDNDDVQTGAYYEVGGLPECKTPCTEFLMPGECCELCGKMAEETED